MFRRNSPVSIRRSNASLRPVFGYNADSTSDRPMHHTGMLSIILPAYNEQEVIPMVLDRFAATAPALAEWGLDYELIFVNDGSKDSTPMLLDQIAATNPHVRAVHLTRNFGHQAAIT